MFAVPGWSVSADSLQAEKAPAAGGPDAGKAKKRKRAGGASPAAGSVTAANVADLYETVVEGKPEGKLKGARAAKPAAQQQPKRQKTARDGHGQAVQGKPAAKPAAKQAGKGDAPRSGASGHVKEEKGAAKQERKAPAKQTTRDAGPPPDTKASEPPAPAPSSVTPALPPSALKPAKLTPLQASMREKLVSARFRHLNETLYTRPSAEALRLFRESPEMFDEYHQGFRRQVQVWPENPVDSFLDDIRARARARPPPPHGRGGGRPGAGAGAGSGGPPLPRTAGTCTIADLGCGDARLAASLQASRAKLRVEVLSYDLHSGSPLVTAADVARLPLPDGAVNVAIFCLALMGTNWIDFVEEAYRVLHWKGELWVAEIKSRFGPARGRRSAPVDHSVGNRKKARRPADDDDDADDDADDAGDLAVEVDGADDPRRQTDVSAFVDVLRRRGFVLRGEPAEAIDLSNRMFVKMHFVKAASPTRGKGVKPQEEAPRATTKKSHAPKRWHGTGDDGDGEDAHEAAVLKPCVYKIR